MVVLFMEITDFEIRIGYFAEDNNKSSDKKIIGYAFVNLLEPSEVYCKKFEKGYGFGLVLNKDGFLVDPKLELIPGFKLMSELRHRKRNANVFNTNGEIIVSSDIPLVIGRYMYEKQTTDISYLYRELPIKLKFSLGRIEPMYEKISLDSFTQVIEEDVIPEHCNIDADAFEKIRDNYCNFNTLGDCIVINNCCYIYNNLSYRFSGDVILDSDCKHFDVYTDKNIPYEVKSIVFPNGIKSCSRKVFNSFNYKDVSFYFSKHTSRGILANMLGFNLQKCLYLNEYQFKNYLNKVTSDNFNFNFY
jgi:hypothetical protein